MRRLTTKCACVLLVLFLFAGWASAQRENPLTRRGEIVVGGRMVSFSVRHLPVSSFPELPLPVAVELRRRGCTIPQTYEAHRPENVIHASLERAGSSDWAALCSVEGRVSLLVFFGGGGEALEMASAEETSRLQTYNARGNLGFNWGIDPATPEQVRQAQSGMKKHPVRLDHDALADVTVDRRTVYRFYSHGAWAQIVVSE